MTISDSALFNVDINNYNGPLDVLLDLAKAQKGRSWRDINYKVSRSISRLYYKGKRFKFRNRFRIFTDGNLVSLFEI